MIVINKKLGREKARGQAHCDDNIIEIDSRLKRKEHLEILIHEALHLLNSSWSETKIILHSKKLATVIWKEKYRRAEI